MKIKHDLGTKNIIVQIYSKSTGEITGLAPKIIDENTVEVSANNKENEDDFNVVIVKADWAGSEWGTKEW